MVLPSHLSNWYQTKHRDAQEEPSFRFLLLWHMGYRLSSSTHYRIPMLTLNSLLQYVMRLLSRGLTRHLTPLHHPLGAACLRLQVSAIQQISPKDGWLPVTLDTQCPGLPGHPGLVSATVPGNQQLKKKQFNLCWHGCMPLTSMETSRTSTIFLCSCSPIQLSGLWEPLLASTDWFRCGQLASSHTFSLPHPLNWQLKNMLMLICLSLNCDTILTWYSLF